MKKLKMELPQGFAQAMNRRHSGNQKLTAGERIEGIVKMQLLWKEYQKAEKELTYCLGDWWDKNEIEKYFKERKWYYAHNKRKRLEKRVERLHRDIFNLLVRTDGNNEAFDNHYALSAEQCYLDFMEKYKKNLLIKE